MIRLKPAISEWKRRKMAKRAIVVLDKGCVNSWSIAADTAAKGSTPGGIPLVGEPWFGSEWFPLGGKPWLLAVEWFPLGCKPW